MIDKIKSVYNKAIFDNIFIYSNPFGSTDFVSMKMFETLSIPWMEKDLCDIDTRGVVYYCGSARMNPVIDRVIEKLGISTFYLSPFDDIAQGMKTIAGRALCAGVINDILLVDWTKKEIRIEVKRILDAGMKSRKFFFGTLVMPLSIPDENISTMFEAAYEYGNYE